MKPHLLRVILVISTRRSEPTSEVSFTPNKTIPLHFNSQHFFYNHLPE
ncbi:hypothetical protein [Candidatus Harpocratesius sp.]